MHSIKEKSELSQEKASKGLYNESTNHNIMRTGDKDASRTSNPPHEGLLKIINSKGRLSKRDSVFFKPSQKDINVLKELVLKVSTDLLRIYLRKRGTRSISYHATQATLTKKRPPSPSRWTTSEPS